MSYVHGYHERESERLRDQAGSLVDLLHHDTSYAPGERVLEAGCGVGAQTVTLAANSPEARFTSVDLSAESAAEAERRVREAGHTNVEFGQADIFDLPYAEASFDHVFICFVLEHLADPVGALERLKVVLKPGGTITVIEGDHGSAYFHPDSAAAHDAIQCQVDAPARRRRRLRDRPPRLPAADRTRASPTCTSRRAWSTWTTAAPTSWTASPAGRSPR